MGSVAVLHPQDVLKDPKSMKYPGRSPNFTPTSNRNPNPNPNPTLSKPSNRRKRSPQKKIDRSGHDSSRSPPKTHLQMGQVKILKRGEALTDLTEVPSFQKENSPVRNKENDLLKKNVETQRFAGQTAWSQKENSPVLKMKTKKKKDENPRFDGGSKGLVARQIRLVDFYAGSAFISSPSPSSLPVPAFFKKNGGDSVVTEINNNNNNEATIDLLRLLNLKPLVGDV